MVDSTVRFINPPEIAASPNYTHVVETTARRTAYISGQVALDRDGNLVGAGDLRAQTRQVFENLKHALAAVGATFEDVVKICIYMTDISQIAAIREIRSAYIRSSNPPASTAVGVSALYRPDVLIEIDAVAVLSDLHDGGPASASTHV